MDEKTLNKANTLWRSLEKRNKAREIIGKMCNHIDSLPKNGILSITIKFNDCAYNTYVSVDLLRKMAVELSDENDKNINELHQQFNVLKP